jgi:2-(1,2-epoxy-1,2-dihydrophenyl)acetyl-CoA isomerase
MSAAPVLVRYADGVGRITFNHPEAMNVVDVAMAVAFREAVRALNAEPGIKAIVLTGAGKAFMAGGDLASFRGTDDKPGVAHTLISPIHEALVALAEGPAISIASVGGAAAGAGMSVALATDLCIASESATFTTAYAGVAAPGDCGITWSLPAIVGPRKALELMLLSPRLSATEAATLALVNFVVADDALPEETDRLAARLACGPAQAMRQIKALIRRPAASYAAHLDAERAGFAACAGEADFNEALEAFFTRRKPVFEAE